MDESQKMKDSLLPVLRQMARGFDLNKFAIAHDGTSKDQSLESYVRQKQQELKAEHAGRKRIYLDTNYWLALRDVRMKRRHDKAAVELLHILEELVESNRVVCPISSMNLFEILRQRDVETRTQTVRIVDKLSLGLCLTTHYDRLVDDFVATILGFGKDKPHFERIELDHISHVMGFIPIVFDETEVSVASPLAYSKASYDMGRFTTLEDIVPGLDPDNPETLRRMSSRDDWAEVMNRYKDDRRERTYQDIFWDEFMGAVKTSEKRLELAMHRIYLIQNGRLPSSAEVAQTSPQIARLHAQFFNVFYERKRPTKTLPQFHIQAAIIAKVISEKTRNINPTDLDDVIHGAYALTSSEIFLTERYMAQLLNHPPTNLASEFGVKVISRVSDAVSELATLT